MTINVEQDLNDERKENLIMLQGKIFGVNNELPSNIRYMDKGNVRRVTGKVNSVVNLVPIEDMNVTNQLIMSNSNVVTGVIRQLKKKKEQNWKKGM